MTEKSKFDQGKYATLSVGYVLTIDPRYVRYCYYNVASLSFTAPILRQVGVGEEDEIEKPGIDREMWDKVQHRISSHLIAAMTDNQRMGHFAHVKRVKKIASKAREDALIESKETMQARNQGKLRYPKK